MDCDDYIFMFRELTNNKILLCCKAHKIFLSVLQLHSVERVDDGLVEMRRRQVDILLFE